MNYTEQAKILFDEWERDKSDIQTFPRRKAGFTNRLRNLYQKLDVNNPEHSQAIVYLDVVAVRSGIEIERGI